LNNADAKNINVRLTQKSLTLLQNKDNLIPLLSNPNAKIVHLRADKSSRTTLETTIKKFANVQTLVSKTSFTTEKAKLFEAVKDADFVIVSLHTLSQVPKNQYNMEQETINFLDSLTQIKPVVLVIMGNPYVLEHIPFSDRFSAVLLAFHPLETGEKCAAEALCGLSPITGKLPVELTNYPLGCGIEMSNIYASKSSAKINNFHHKMDSIILSGITQKAYPGCRVLVAKGDTILYNKAFGKFTYTDSRPVKMQTMYDLASLTKVMATTLAIMKLYDLKQIRVEEKLSYYLPYLKNTNKEDITIEQVMTHTAGLAAWIPFYEKTLLNKKPNPAIYSKEYSKEFPVQVCANLYIKASYTDTIYAQICRSELRKDCKYLYSDLGFYLLADLVKTVSGKPLDVYVEENFYKPMNLTRTLFNPLNMYGLNDISPTENDTVFRKTLVHGYVHDQGAAMLGGVAGHAGLFSSADDLLQLAKLLLNKGTYKGKSYFSPQTVEVFTAYRYPQGDCRRGLGCDKPSRSGASPCCRSASALSYGHSGFTGTFIWIDPQYDLIYIFLSNRVNPDAENKKITELGIRTVVQDALYQMVK
jgi:CubicO group peptidase (beta-lactamase class C family)